MPFFDAKSLGVRNIATPLPGLHRVHGVRRLLAWPDRAPSPARSAPTAFQLVDDVSLVRGAHQIGFGANYIRSRLASTSYGSAAGNFAFTGVNTGLGLARLPARAAGDLHAGTGLRARRHHARTSASTRRTPGRCRPNLTLNVGLRWDPYLPYTERPAALQSLQPRRSSARASRSTVYKNAPVGVIFEGDPGYPGPRRQRALSRQLRAAAVGRVGSEGRRPHDACARRTAASTTCRTSGTSSASIAARRSAPSSSSTTARSTIHGRTRRAATRSRSSPTRT